MMRPTLLIQTVFFTQDDDALARRLGTALYARLTRDLKEPLAFGPGIPVLIASAPKFVDTGATERVVLVPVLGGDLFQDQALRATAIAQLKDWHARSPRVCVLAVAAARPWQELATSLAPIPLVRHVEDPRSERALVDQIVLTTARCLQGQSGDVGVRLFVSHDDVDQPGAHAAVQIQDYVRSSPTHAAFFELCSRQVHSGHELAAQLEDAKGRGVLIVLRSDQYSSRTWCQSELLGAKQRGFPALSVDLLDAGESRSLPYVGNVPSLVWRRDPAPVISRAMDEWLKTRHFQLETTRIIATAGLPADTRVTLRPPELLDFAQGPLNARRPTLVLHPDPELSVQERILLKRAQPRLRLVTPTSLYRRMLRDDAAPAMDAPLSDLQIALSLSDSPDAGGPQGFTAEHVCDATIQLARTLLSAGAELAYGGDFRDSGFSFLLHELVRAYNQMAEGPDRFLHSYLPATRSAPAEFAATVHAMDEAHRVLSPPAGKLSPARAALHESDNRRRMAGACFARVALAGQAKPQDHARGPGYRGRFPGVVEEVWWSLTRERPVYVCGGFGGAAAIVADLLEGRGDVPLLRDATFASVACFARRAHAFDDDPDREKLGLPGSMDELADQIREAGRRHLASDEIALRWNGLTRQDNLALFRSRDPLTIATLVSTGLLRMAAQRASRPVAIELVHGSITDVTGVDAIAVALFHGVDALGVGAALDRLLGGRLSTARAARHQLVSLPGEAIDADWLYLADLGRPGDRQLQNAIERAAADTVATAGRCGFTRVAVVTFGGSTATQIDEVVDAMMRGFQSAPSPITLVWFELKEERFSAIRARLQTRDDVRLSTRRVELATPLPEAAEPQAYVDVRWSDDRVESFILPPGSCAAALSTSMPLCAARIGELADRGVAPAASELPGFGESLGRELFGDDGAAVLDRCGDARIIVLHDRESAAIPFEAIHISGRSLAIEHALVRRPMLPGISPEMLVARPLPAAQLKIFLVVNPTGDLPGADAEAEALEEILASIDAVKLVKVLRRDQATKPALLEAMRYPDLDVLHYIGHAFYAGPALEQSGIICAGGDRLTAADMASEAIQPRLAFLNACEGGRIRDLQVASVQPAVPSMAFAEIFLRGRVEAYLGTLWKVNDAAAARFAASVYHSLACGRRLFEAVADARRALRADNQADWANYILYGDGGLRMRQS